MRETTAEWLERKRQEAYWAIRQAEIAYLVATEKTPA